MLTIFLIVLVLMVLGGLPQWGSGWGYRPSGVAGTVLILLVIWILFFGGRRFF